MKKFDRDKMFRPFRMSGAWRRWMYTLFSSMGLAYTRIAAKEEILLFFKSLYPYDCGYELIRCGGYLVPDDLQGVEAVFSPGVGPSSDFEFFFAERGIPCYLADASVSKPALFHKNFNFVKKYIGSRTEGSFLAFYEWINQFYPAGENGILQMDIEGGEFETILSVDQDILNKFRIIVIEMHCLNIVNTKEGLLLCNLFINKLLVNFNVCHFHVNNGIPPLYFKGLKFPGVIELTLIRKDRCRKLIPVKKLPHHLDVESVKEKPSLILLKDFEAGVIK